MMRLRTLLIPAVLTALTVPTGTAHATPASGPQLLTAVAGEATFCLDEAAHGALEKAGIKMSAAEPAQLLTTRPHPCVTTYVPEGAVSLGLTGGDFPFNGTVTFTRAADDASVTFSDIKVTFAVPSTVAAVVNGTGQPITVLTFLPSPGNIMTNGSYMIAYDVPLKLTQAGASALAGAFSTSPIRNGATLFEGTGHGHLESPLLPLPPLPLAL